MEIEISDKKVIFTQESSHYLFSMKKWIILLQAFFLSVGFFKEVYSEFLYWIGWGFITIFQYISYYNLKQNKFISEKMILQKNYIEIQHLVKRKLIRNYILEIKDISDIRYEKKTVPLIYRNGDRKNLIEESRFLKIIDTKNNIYSFGLFIKEDEAKKIKENITNFKKECSLIRRLEKEEKNN